MATYDPFKELQQFMNQAFNAPKSLTMPMDLRKVNDTYVADIDLPGVDPDSIDIDVDDRTITIRAERQATQTKEGHEWVSRERSFGTYARQLTVGSGLALDKISANYADGVLTLTIPVAEEAKPRKVQVQRSNTQALDTGKEVPGSVEDHTETQTEKKVPVGVNA